MLAIFFDVRQKEWRLSMLYGKVQPKIGNTYRMQNKFASYRYNA